MGIYSMQVFEYGYVSSSSVSILLSSIADRPDLIQLVQTSQGIGFDNGTPETSRALYRYLNESVKVHLDGPGKENARWRVEIQKSPDTLPKAPSGSPFTRIWRLKQKPLRWSGVAKVFLKLGGRAEIPVGTLYLNAPDLEFLPPPGNL
jgi:hypothetical protein